MPKRCYFDQKNIPHADHHDPALLSRFLTQWGRIKARGETGLCAKHQRMVARAVKQARQLGILAAQVKVR